MDRNEKYIARLMFKNKIYESDKQSFEDLFVRVMLNKDQDFKPVKPQGRYGDWKNDGFNQVKGEYFQVYGPEDIALKEDEANSKLEEDFNGLYEKWTNKGFKIKKYNFVINDKYKGAFPTLYAKAKEIAKKKKIECEVLLSKSVEDIFLQLTDDQIIDVVGVIPDALSIENLDYNVMSEIIKYLLAKEMRPLNEKIPLNPDFEKKISFNSLSEPIAQILNAGRRQNFAIRDYFELNSEFAKDELRKIFQDMYYRAMQEIPNSPTKNDEVFQYITDNSSPHNNLATYSAVYVLMAYYFEYCDIFQVPVS